MDPDGIQKAWTRKVLIKKEITKAMAATDTISLQKAQSVF